MTALVFIILSLAALALAAAAIHRSRINRPEFQTLDTSGIDTDPEAWLAGWESRFTDIRAGAHKQIVWADPQMRGKTPLVLVYIHGFSASAGEMRPMPDRVAAALGANLYFARLNGHGRGGEAMGEARAQDWMADFAESIAVASRLGDRIVVIASSTGASLTTLALTHEPFSQQVSAVVFLSPNYGINSRAAFLLTAPFGRQITRMALGKTRAFSPQNALHAERWTTAYPASALIPMAHLVRQAIRAPVGAIRTPALFLYSGEDKVVLSERTQAIAARWGGASRAVDVGPVGDPSHHIIAGDALSPATTDTIASHILTWLRETLSLK